MNSDILDKSILTKYSSEFGSRINLDKLGTEDDFDEFSSTNSDQIIFLRTIYYIFAEAVWCIKQDFNKNNINYVSPLRAYPQRYYLLDSSKVNNSIDSIDGNQLAEVLLDNEELKNNVNVWLNKFGFDVSVSQIKDVIHNISVTQNKLKLDITDVGFGISQVLPIIVQGLLSRKNTLTIIEQPEVHLHPKMQAELADLFIEIIKEGKSLLIETHSEYLLRRLRRRIADETISNDDVAIYFVESKGENERSAILKRLDITSTGDFDWPKDFYCDKLEDNIEFLKRQ
ncbi:MAG: hypothetical protein H6Q16_1235 [Bacteroidetes bacterium]|nr:hypothetical protein [Bacteroidota bacterium]